jgi:hypothetical protein
MARPRWRDARPTTAVVRRRVGYRRALVIDGRVDAAASAELVEAYWDAIEEGARAVWIVLSTSDPLAPSLTARDRAAGRLKPRTRESTPMAECR